MTLQPLPAEKNTLIEFVDETTGTNVPKQFLPGIQKGLHEAAQKGVLNPFKFR